AIGRLETTLKKKRLPGPGNSSLKSTSFRKIAFMLPCSAAIRKRTFRLIRKHTIIGKKSSPKTGFCTALKKTTSGRWGRQVRVVHALKYTSTLGLKKK